MAKKALVIVESPSKAKTIQKYLGRDYIVKACVGHIKDLPKSKLGVDPDKSFKIDYQIIPGKAKVMEVLERAFETVPTVYLATDPDREGEAIAFHLQEELKARGKKFYRVLLNSITKPAILEAIANPAKLNKDLYAAQQARRILDRLVGYKISPLLWEKVKRGISAGRVQSVALRLVTDREKEIKAFKADEYWDVDAIFGKDGKDFRTRLFKVNGVDPDLTNEASTTALLKDIDASQWKISQIERKERSRRPTAPFITSRLQQEAARKLGFSAKKTMTLAQKLYEGIDLGDLGTTGLITYMRTDSVRIEPGAMNSIREYIHGKYGRPFLPDVPNVYKTKKDAQDAHEAIRPTSFELEPSRVERFLDRDEARLYQLIWDRTIASQMTPAVYDQTAVDIAGKGKSGAAVTFRANGSVVKFPGFTAVYMEGHDEAARGKKKVETENDDAEETGILDLPQLKEGDVVLRRNFEPTQHFTQPPPRFTDASLIRDLEDKGIGRPSTYASILSNIQDREYVEKREGRYYPSELGTVVADLLIESFPEIMDVAFTADMEHQLDDIEEGKTELNKTLGKFWKGFQKTLAVAKVTMKNLKAQEIPTDLKCTQCGGVMLIKWGKMGSFLACKNYPECKNTQDYKKDEQGVITIVPKEYIDKKCPKCTKPLLVKTGKFGKFIACSDYPDCKHTESFTIGITCPVCKEGEIAEKLSRYRRLFYSCNRWPKCEFSCWDKPIEKPCPLCKFPLTTQKLTKRKGLIEKCADKTCKYSDVLDPLAGQAAS